MNNWKIIGPVVAIALAVAALAIGFKQWGYHRHVSDGTRDIGQDLITHANSSRLANLPLGFAPQLSTLLASPTQISAVLMGDDPAPLGDGSACSRLILTNQSARGIHLRLGQTQDPEKFRIIGYWPLDKPPRMR
jgi:hypothetical protein